MNAQELIRGLSDVNLEEVATAAIAEVRERNLSIPALETVGGLAVEGVQSSAADADISEETKQPVDTKESIFSQLSNTYSAYVEVANVVAEDYAHEDTLKTELEAWLTEDKLDYVTKAQEADPELKFTLVATPNVLVDSKKLVKLAKAFGEEQPYSTYVYEELYHKYTKEQLSGTSPDNDQAVIFSLIPSKLDDRLTGTVAKQRATLAELQTNELADLRVASPLEAVSYWYTLRANGNKLNSSETFYETYIRHFDLPEKRFRDWQLVASSFVSDGGRPGLDYSYAGGESAGRVVVG